MDHPERVKELEGQLEELIASEQDLHLVKSPAQMEGLGKTRLSMKSPYKTHRTSLCS